ncbi:hypothetical protein Clacol_006893 [Clathrus columnatus]|uniref:Uncharacterized protein n=1 Tax=Clathrus columnatus TaxID=1419009 RepID=A0AAV5AHM0_9AGAM|nr:hypothetical protein Clacol_006893 [Clathrus columnatus]
MVTALGSFLIEYNTSRFRVKLCRECRNLVQSVLVPKIPPGEFRITAEIQYMDDLADMTAALEEDRKRNCLTKFFRARSINANFKHRIDKRQERLLALGFTSGIWYAVIRLDV